MSQGLQGLPRIHRILCKDPNKEMFTGRGGIRTPDAKMQSIGLTCWLWGTGIFDGGVFAGSVQHCLGFGSGGGTLICAVRMAISRSIASSFFISRRNRRV